MAAVKAVNHIGIAVRSIADQRDYYENVLGAVYEGEELVADQKVKVAFFRVGDVRLELLEPSEPSSTVASFIERRGEGLHHVALEVDDLQARIDQMKTSGLRMIDQAPRAGSHGLQIAFAHPKSTFGVLTEFCQVVPDES